MAHLIEAVTGIYQFKHNLVSNSRGLVLVTETLDRRGNELIHINSENFSDGDDVRSILETRELSFFAGALTFSAAGISLMLTGAALVLSDDVDQKNQGYTIFTGGLVFFRVGLGFFTENRKAKGQLDLLR